LGANQRKHDEEHQADNCVACQLPAIATLVLHPNLPGAFQ
jgi:hypothetical protein